MKQPCPLGLWSKFSSSLRWQAIMKIVSSTQYYGEYIAEERTISIKFILLNFKFMHPIPCHSSLPYEHFKAIVITVVSSFEIIFQNPHCTPLELSSLNVILWFIHNNSLSTSFNLFLPIRFRSILNYWHRVYVYSDFFGFTKYNPYTGIFTQLSFLR